MSEFVWPKYPDTSAFKMQLTLKSVEELEEIRERCLCEIRANDPLRDVAYTHLVCGDGVLKLASVDEALRYAREARERVAKGEPGR